jgi:4-diphosphocytidyl-2-C-methyl-D-erythritol kinase
MTCQSLSFRSPAKINWFLKVLALRSDGYHEIRSLIQKITLYDELTFSASDDIILRSDLNVPVEENLVYKAIRLLKVRYNVQKGIAIELKKRIPLGAGLGGGSSDAATTLRGLNELWSLRIPDVELCKIAEELGSDVPFFLNGPLSYVEGRGERVIEYEAERPLSLLLVKPFSDISTEWAYRTFADLKKQEGKLTKEGDNVDNMKQFISCVKRADIHCISRFNDVILNDLEAVSLRAFPLIAEIKERLLREGALFSLMSGSGSTVFGVFDSQEKAVKASEAFKDFWTVVVKTIIEEN